MTNRNCLKGMRCPECGAEGPFDVRMQVWVRWTDDGTSVDELSQEYDPEDTDRCRCVSCDHEIVWGCFKRKSGKRQAGRAKAIMATFVPQAWVQGCSVDVDLEPSAVAEFDVAGVVEAMGREKALALVDCSTDTDSLLHHPLSGALNWMQAWPGPYEIKAAAAIRKHFDEIDAKKAKKKKRSNNEGEL